MKTNICKIIFRLIPVLLLAVLLSACAWKKEMDRNNRNLAKIRKGMTKQQVIQIMGEPLKGETYCRDNVFFYYTRQEWMDGMTTRDECTPIYFNDQGRVEGWGKDFNTGIYNVQFIPISSRSK